MSASDHFRELLVSRDGFIEELDLDNAEVDAQGTIRAHGLIVVKKQDLGQVGVAIRASSFAKVRDHLEWTSRSVHARLGLEVASIQSANAILSHGDLHLPAVFALKPWEDRDGHPDENPLSPHLKNWLERTRIACGRLFMRPLDVGPLTGNEIQEAGEAGKIEMNGALILQDGAVLPVHKNERYPLRYDLMDTSSLREAMIGSGRGVIDSIQPRIREDLLLRSGAYGIGSTRCSLLEHRGVLEPHMFHLATQQEQHDVVHGTSRIWDPGKTTGMQHARHLEVQNLSDRRIRLSDFGVKMTVYPTYAEHSVVSHITRSLASDVQRNGLNLDHFLRSDKDREEKFRATLDEMNAQSYLAGILVGPSGIHNVVREKHPAQQDQAMIVAANNYGHTEEGVPNDIQRELCDYMGSMGDPRQRAILFAREIPSSGAIQKLMERGVRTIVTDNISNTEGRIYVSSSQLQHLRSLGDKGLSLYLQTPKNIRKLWHNFFVDVHSIEKMEKATVRFCIYCASAAGGDRLLEMAQYPQFLEAMQKDFPHAAIVTGAAKNGAMEYANRVARDLGITTIGVANHIANQETTEVALDAGTFFDGDGFNARQELMSRTGAFPIIGPGAQGSEFEGSLERVLAKIGKSQIPPITYIDPVGLGANEGHLWQPVMDLERGYSQVTPVKGGDPIQLTRSPYVANLTTLHTSYLRAYETQIRPFTEDPFAFWKRSGVPPETIRTAMARVVRDSIHTGLPIPFYLEPVLKQLDIAF